MTKRRPDGLPKTIKIARQVHYCAKCGTLIKKGDKMTVRRPDSFGLVCLKCDGRYPEWVKAEGQDNPIGDDSLALSGGARHRRRLSVYHGRPLQRIYDVLLNTSGRSQMLRLLQTG
jgi:hypothetical protein